MALVDLITNPLLAYALLVIAHLAGWGPRESAGYVVALIIGEVLVIVAEWRLLFWVLGGSSRRMLGVSVAINALSALAGVVLWGLVA